MKMDEKEKEEEGKQEIPKENKEGEEKKAEDNSDNGKPDEYFKEMKETTAEMKKANEDRKKLIEREEKLQAKKESIRELGGNSEAGQKEGKKEETDSEYRKRIEKDVNDGKYN